MKIGEIHTRFDVFRDHKVVGQRDTYDQAEELVAHDREIHNTKSSEYSVVKVVSERVA